MKSSGKHLELENIILSEVILKQKTNDECSLSYVSSGFGFSDLRVELGVPIETRKLESSHGVGEAFRREQ